MRFHRVFLFLLMLIVLPARTNQTIPNADAIQASPNADAVLWQHLSHIVNNLKKCNASNLPAYKTLFRYSSQDWGGGALTEDVSEAIEDAFIQCPKPFLLALQQQSITTQNSILNYFGIVHPPWELAKILFKFEKDPQVGTFVLNNFGSMINQFLDKNGSYKHPPVPDAASSRRNVE